MLAAACCVQAMLEKAVSERSYVESHGKPVPGFTYMSASEAAAKIAERRKQVHSRWLKLWAKRILATPEQALVPLKERDALLASRHEVRMSFPLYIIMLQKHSVVCYAVK
jgi:hypothetical protein